MVQRLHDALGFAEHAIRLVVHDAVAINPWLAALGVALFVLNEVVRTRGWVTILRCAYPSCPQLRERDVQMAYLAGTGLNAILPARGGDVVKLALVKRHIPESRWSTLVATFVPETLFETLFGAVLVAWMFARGFLPIPNQLGELPAFDASFVIDHPVLTLIIVVATVSATTVVIRLARRSGRATAARFKQGLRILGTPKRFLTGVVSWQALARLIRLGSLAAFMGAFHLPVTLETTVLVMAAQGAGRILPLGPASAGLRLAMLSYGFVEVTGHQVDIGEITIFTFGVGALLGATGLIIAGVVLAREFGTVAPRRVLEAARARFSADQDRGADWNPVEQLDHVGHPHPNAPV
jgi:Lysylphosphatidylglycerol synthase TM region